MKEPEIGAAPRRHESIARGIIARVVAEHGEEVWITEGYAAGDDLAALIAQALAEEATT